MLPGCGTRDAESMMIGQHKRPLDQAVDQPAKYLKPSSDDAKLHGDDAVEPGKQPRAQPRVNDAVLANGQGPCWRSVLGGAHEAAGSTDADASGADGRDRGEQEGNKEQPGHGAGGPNGAYGVPRGFSAGAASPSQNLDDGRIMSLEQGGRDGTEHGATVVSSDPILTAPGDPDALFTPSSAHPRLLSAVGRNGPEEGGKKDSVLEDGTAQRAEPAAGVAYCEMPEADHRSRRSRGSLEDPVVFLETVENALEARKTKRSRPLPVMMAGKVLNLYSLNSKVRELGGYCKVTADSLWGNVAQELGLSQNCGPGVKLIYFKYLRKLESRKSQGAAVPRLSGELTKAVASQSFFPGNEICNGKEERSKAGVGVEQSGDSESSKEEGDDGRAHCDTGGDVGLCMQNENLLESRESWLPDVHDGNSKRLGSASLSRAGVGLVELTEENVADGRDLLGQSKTESLAHLLNWIRRLAVDPRDASGGEATGFGHDADWVQECHSQAEKIRAFLWRKKDELRSKAAAPAVPADTSYGQNKQPSRAHYYEEPAQPADPQALDRLRSTRERSLHYGFPSSPGVHRPAQGGGTHRGSSFLAQGHIGSRLPSSPLTVSYNEAALSSYNFSIVDRGNRKKIPIGPEFQATVPPWKPPVVSAADVPHNGLGDTSFGDDSGSDLQRWLGKRVWPPLDCKKVVNKDRLGKGRSDTCSCEDVESIECVRLHIEEERHRLSEELGIAFTSWKFEEMGECVADQWTKEEQHVYKTLAKLNPATFDKNFWDHLPIAFPTRSMKELVSYYFNVFVLRRRAIQNRLHGEKIDSDDDETELPVTDSEFSEDNDTEDEDGEDADDGIGEGDLTEPPPIVEDDVTKGRHFPELEASFNYSTSKIEADCSEEEHDVGVMDLATTTGLRLDDEDPTLQLVDHRHLHVPTSLGVAWESELHGDEKHQLEEVPGIGDDALQEVQRWEDPHWDETDHDFVKDHPKQESSLPKDGLVQSQGTAEPQASA